MDRRLPRNIFLGIIGVGVFIVIRVYARQRSEMVEGGFIEGIEELFKHMRANSFTSAIWLNVLMQGVSWMVLVCRFTPDENMAKRIGKRFWWGWFGSFMGSAAALPLQMLCDEVTETQPGADALTAVLAFLMMYVLPALLTWFYTDGAAIVFTVAILGMVMPVIYEKLAPRPFVSYQVLQALALVHGMATWMWPVLSPPEGPWLPNPTSKGMLFDHIFFNIPAAVWVWEAGRPLDAAVALLIPAAGMFGAFHHLDTSKQQAGAEAELVGS